MFIPALLLPHQNLDPVAKYFLVRFVLRFGIVAPVQCGVKELAKMIGVSDRLVTKSLADLVGHGLLSHQAVSEGRGRPKSEYRCTPSFVATLREFSSSLSSPQKTVIAHLLERAALGDGRGRAWSGAAAVAVFQDKMTPGERLANLRARKKSDRLSDTNRLLLAVLLTRADRFGVVSDFGSSELRKTTGLSQERLRCGISRLLDLGLIRIYVPGATSQFFFDKITSVYFLNLQHPEISDGSNVTLALAYKLERPLDSMQNVSSIYQEVCAFNQSPKQFAGTQSGRLLGFFKKQRLEFFCLLQHVLMKYVAHLLSKYWSGLPLTPSNNRIDFPELRELIRRDFRLPQMSLVGHADRYAILVDELYGRALESAISIKSVLFSALEVSLESMDFVFIPQPVDSAYCRFTLLALPQSPAEWCGCKAILEEATGRHVETFSCEADIPLEDQYRFGLRAKPSPKRGGRAEPL